MPTLQKIQGDLNNWHKGPFSWFSRAAILKMNVLPRLLYLLQAIPIRLPPSFFASYKRMCRSLIWSFHSPRLSWDKLTLPKRKGGIILHLLHCWTLSLILFTSTSQWVIMHKSLNYICFYISFLAIFCFSATFFITYFTRSFCNSQEPF